MATLSAIAAPGLPPVPSRGADPIAPRPSNPPHDTVHDGTQPLLAGRYRLGACFEVRGPVARFLGEQCDPDGTCTPVLILREPIAGTDAARPAVPAWPSLAWVEDLDGRARHLGLPRLTDRLEEGGAAYLIFEAPMGVSLWDAWDDPAVGSFERYGWLIDLAELLRTLHRIGVAVESLRPEQVRISPLGQVFLDSTTSLLPTPLPAGAPCRPTPVSAPELIRHGRADARSGQYCFGTVLYALELGHELSELDFTAPGELRPFLDHFPDAHPLLSRLMAKTLHPDPEQRFPTGASADLSGFDELIANLRRAQKELGRARLDLAAWSSTGMVRAGNEDALALVHAVEAREDDADEHALVLVADGMGGSAAGEVAATLAVHALRQHLLAEPPFQALTEEPGLAPYVVDRDTVRQRIEEAIKEANRQVYLAARERPDRRGMGCTAEAVYLDGRQYVVGHVGDSRTYHFRRGRLTLVTRDQTLVGTLVELGQITEEEAETHPRRCELRQAIGGRVDVEPEFYAGDLAPGDWVVVCTDGLTGVLRPPVIQDVLQSSTSAEQAARRLINRANQGRAADNVTVVVVRAS